MTSFPKEGLANKMSTSKKRMAAKGLILETLLFIKLILYLNPLILETWILEVKV